MNFYIYNFAKQKVLCEIPDTKTIAFINIKDISGDEVVSVNFYDGTFVTFDSQELNKRIQDIFNGEENIVGCDSIREWLHKRKVAQDSEIKPKSKELSTAKEQKVENLAKTGLNKLKKVYVYQGNFMRKKNKHMNKKTIYIYIAVRERKQGVL